MYDNKKQDNTLYIASEICEHEYENRTDIERVEIINSVKTIGAYAFAGCTSLREINIPDSMKTIGKFAFMQCESLKSITVPDSVTEIEEDAFFGCADLTIRGKKGSEAERYAKEYGITFIEVSKNVF